MPGWESRLKSGMKMFWRRAVAPLLVGYSTGLGESDSVLLILVESAQVC